MSRDPHCSAPQPGLASSHAHLGPCLSAAQRRRDLGPVTKGREVDEWGA